MNDEPKESLMPAVLFVVWVVFFVVAPAIYGVLLGQKFWEFLHQ